MQGFKQKKQSVPAQVTCFMLTKCLLYAYYMLILCCSQFFYQSKITQKDPQKPRVASELPPSCLRDASELPPISIL
jgi:hypothetical protein